MARNGLALDRDSLIPAICALVARGQLVKDACAAHNVLPDTLNSWVLERDAKPEHVQLYARARMMQAHAMAEEALALADSAIPGKDGDTDKVRLQVDTRKWLVSKIAPRYYGERTEHEHSGNVQITVKRDGE